MYMDIPAFLCIKIELRTYHRFYTHGDRYTAMYVLHIEVKENQQCIAEEGKMGRTCVR